MERKEIKLNHFNFYSIIAIIALIYFSIKCIQFYFEVGIPKEIWEIIIANEKNKATNLLEKIVKTFSFPENIEINIEKDNVLDICLEYPDIDLNIIM